jgi:hypothetical protein
LREAQVSFLERQTMETIMRKILLCGAAVAILAGSTITVPSVASARTYYHSYRHRIPYARRELRRYALVRPYVYGQSYGSGGGWRTRLNHRPWNFDQRYIWDRQLSGAYD